MLAMIGPSFSLSARQRNPRLIGHEGAPLLLALGKQFPGQQIVQVVVAVADQHGPEPAWRMPCFSQILSVMSLEPLEQVGQAAGKAV